MSKQVSAVRRFRPSLYAPAMEMALLSDSAERAPPIRNALSAQASASFLATQHFAPRGVTLAAGGTLAALYEPAAESLTVSGMPIETAVIELERIEGRTRCRTSGPTPKRSR